MRRIARRCFGLTSLVPTPLALWSGAIRDALNSLESSVEAVAAPVFGRGSSRGEAVVALVCRQPGICGLALNDKHGKVRSLAALGSDLGRRPTRRFKVDVTLGAAVFHRAIGVVFTCPGLRAFRIWGSAQNRAIVCGCP